MLTWIKKLFGIKPPVKRPTHNLALWVIKDSLTLVNLNFDCWEYKIIGVKDGNLFIEFAVRNTGSIENHVITCNNGNTVTSVRSAYPTVRPQKVNCLPCLSNVVRIPLESITRGY